jgi:hypothetical protein
MIAIGSLEKISCLLMLSVFLNSNCFGQEIRDDEAKKIVIYQCDITRVAISNIHVLPRQVLGAAELLVG